MRNSKKNLGWFIYKESMTKKKISIATKFPAIKQEMYLPQNNLRLSSGCETFWRPFTRVFQVMCVSHYSVYRSNLRDSFWKSLLFLLYFLVFASVHVTFLTLTLIKGIHEGRDQQFMKHRESPLMFYINCLSIFGTFTTHATTHLETLLNGRRENEIHQKLKKINDIFATKLNYIIDHRARRLKCVRKTVSVFIFAWILSAGSSLVTLPISNHDKYFNQPLLIFTVAIIRCRGCHIALHLDTIADILKDLQFLLRRQQIKSHQKSDKGYKRENIRYLREIYSNVWLIKTMMSDCFGWSLITFLVEFSIEVINSSYWFYINLNLYGSNSLNIRKYGIEWEIAHQLLIQSIFYFFRYYAVQQLDCGCLLVLLHAIRTLPKYGEY